MNNLELSDDEASSFRLACKELSHQLVQCQVVGVTSRTASRWNSSRGSLPDHNWPLASVVGRRIYIVSAFML